MLISVGTGHYSLVLLFCDGMKHKVSIDGIYVTNALARTVLPVNLAWVAY